jgi:hypothetical protein
MDINEFFKDVRFVVSYGYNWGFGGFVDTTMPTHRTRIILVDGESVSVQASETHYCAPRQTISVGELKQFNVPYYEYEIGFPSFKADEWMEYAEQPEQPTETVYGYVPVSVVQAVIDSHGGIDVDATLAFKKKREEERTSKVKGNAK